VLRLALRNVFRHKSRTALTLAIIVLGVVALVLSGGFVEDSLLQLREATIHSQLGHLQIHSAGNRQGAAPRPRRMIDDPAAIARQVKDLSQVEDVMARLTFEAVLNNGHTGIPILGVGMEPEKEAKLGSFVTIIAGRQLSGKDSYEILLGEGVAAASKLKPGDRAILVTNTVAGALNNIDFTVAGIFRSFSKDYDARAVRIPIAAAQELLDVQAVNEIAISLKETESTDDVAAILKKQLNPRAYEIDTWEHLADFYEKTMALYRRQFLVMQIIVLIAVLQGVSSSVSMTIFERIGEFGTMKALGNRSGSIFQLAVTENMLLGLMGSGAGVVLGVMLAWSISLIGIPMPPPPNSSTGYTATIRIVPWVLVSAFVVGFLATLMAAILPARKAAQLPVVEALRQNQ
jgi:putative ABC transport system permease protein